MAFKILKSRLQSPRATTRYPSSTKDVPPGPFQNIELDAPRLQVGPGCADACPTGALTSTGSEFRVDHGACIACGRCVDACGPGGLKLTRSFELAARTRADLVETVRFTDDPALEATSVPRTQAELDHAKERLQSDIARVFRRSLHIREVAAGGCNGCEVEAVNLMSPYYDVERLGIQFVASPRHADMLLVTGPVSWHMADPLRVCYDAMPEPRLVVAVGACGIMGGPFVGSYAVTNGVHNVLPVDVYIPGCPPRPEALIHGIMLAVGRAEQKIQAHRHDRVGAALAPREVA